MTPFHSRPARSPALTLAGVLLAAGIASAAPPCTAPGQRCDDGDPCTIDEPCDPVAGCVVRRLPDLEFMRCRASGLLPIEACRRELPRRVRRPLARMQRLLDRVGRPTSHRELTRALGHLHRFCHRAKRRLERAIDRREPSECLVRQRRGLDDVCPDRVVPGAG